MNTWDLWDQIKGKMPWLEGAETGLLGEKTTTLPGKATERSGGVFGYGGAWDQGSDMAKQGLQWAGGKAGEAVDAGKDYFMGEKVWTPDAPTNLSRTGVHSSKSMEHLDTVLKKTDQAIDTSVKKGDELANQVMDWAFPNAPWMKDKVSKEDKQKLTSMAETGKVDNGFLQALKQKSEDPKEQPAGAADISGLEKFIGVSKEDAMQTWKDKGGFEGLMSNPAFTLGLALMQSSANGKTINEGILDNFVKSAKISSEFKDRIAARTKVLGPPTKEERDLAAGALQSIGISGPGWGTKAWDTIKLWGKDNTAAYNAGLNKIIIKAKEKIRKKYKGKTHTITEQDYIDAFKEMEASGEMGSVENIFSVGIKDMKNPNSKKSKIKQWVEEKLGKDNFFTRAEGGPVKAGQPYLVGEKGPEIVIPRQDGQVLSNDDSQIFAMLLEANPQLKNVSRKRAEAILKSRFPDYFV